MKRIILVFGSFFFASITYANEVNVELELRTNQQQIEKGAQFQAIIALKILNSKNKVDLRQVNIPGIKNFLQVGSSQSNQIAMMNGAVSAISEMRKTLLAHKTGTFQLGPVRLSLNTPQGEVIKVSSNSLQIVVEEDKYSAPVTTEARDHKKRASEILRRNKNREPQAPVKKIINVFLIFFLLGGGGAFIFYISQPHRKRRRQKRQEKQSQQEWAKAKRELILPKRESIHFYSQMRSFVVEYIRNQKQVEVGALTTTELLGGIEGMEERAIIENILKICDQYRYAREEVDRSALLLSAQQLKDKNSLKK